MKQAKKLASLLLALVMVFALATTAFAAQEGELGNGTITISNAVVGQKYSVYQILYLESYHVDDTDTGEGQYAYKANSAWAEWLGKQTEYVSIDAQGYVTWVEGADAAAFAKLAQAYATENNITSDSETVTAAAPADDPKATTTTVTFSDLKLGYYLVDSTLGTLCSLDTTSPNVTITEKNETPTNVKTVEEDSDESWKTANDADIGQTVNFKSTITAQPGAENYVFHDTMSEGLTFSDSVTVTVGSDTLTAGTDYTLVTSGMDDNCTFEISFSKNYLDSITDETTIVISYSATLNSNAVIGGNGNPNDSHLSYGDTNNVKTTPKSTTTTYTWDVDVFKYYLDENGEEKSLADATFTLSKDKDGSDPIELVDLGDNTYRVATADDTDTNTVTTITTDSSGKFTVQGLDSDTYYLTETAAPAGYNKLADSIKIVIDNEGKVNADNENTEGVEQVKVLNQSGTELPSTGGIGTTIFYAAGGILVVCAAVLLITKKRMSAK